MLSSSEIRRQYIDYFVKRHQHCFVPSTSVVPHDDPTLLFANAGMNQFKDMFLGTGQRDYLRAVNSQKCIRAGGKHNDLEDVGKDTYHHTFFEMLGNWSFGDYFKEEAIVWAWELLVNVWGLDKSRLHATVFGGDVALGLEPDQEAANLWAKKTDIDPSHIHLGSKEDNFWEMGDTGPCGPCSELHFDLTGDKSGGALVNAGDARVIEIWNLVFIQFNRDSQGKLTLLPAKHVDTGMGFERICAVLQGKASNYDTDVFEPLFNAIQDVTGASPYGGKLDDKVDMAYRVIADHLRCLTFALTDGAVPSNEGRGYVLRRILRRAVRHGWQTLGVKDPFLHRLVPAVVDAMGEPFSELTQKPQRVVELIKDEEESFGRTLEAGITRFAKAGARAISDARLMIRPEILVATGKDLRISIDSYDDEVTSPYPIIDVFVDADGDKTLECKIKFFDITPAWINKYFSTPPAISDAEAFRLHDTYGFPLDLTQVMAEERGLTVDVDGFHRLMEEARNLSRAGGKQGSNDIHALIEVVQRGSIPATEFFGYEKTEGIVTTPVRLYEFPGIKAVVIDKTPFYAESGGQVGDSGIIELADGSRFHVENTVKVGDVVFHRGYVSSGEPTSSDSETVHMMVRSDRRDKIMSNHTATHLMNRALRHVLGDHIQQKGSLVDDQKLRFDFSHNAPVATGQMDQIEQMVNTDIGSDLPVYIEEAPQDAALKINSLRAVFGEKYPPKVRVVSIGVPVGDLLTDVDNDKWWGYSIEFCGGTHLGKTGDAEGFIILNEEAVAKGVRRITALTGAMAHRASAQGEMLVARLETLLGSNVDQLAMQVADLASAVESKQLPALARVKLRNGITQLQRKIKDHAKQQSKKTASAVIEEAKRIAQMSQDGLIVTSLDGADANALRVAMDVIRKKNPDTAMLIAGVCDNKVAFLAAVPKTMIEKGLKAGDWVREVAKAAGGGGGGRPDVAQAGGKDATKLDDALQVGRQFAVSILKGDG